MKFLELCAGIGGFRQALENLGCECVLDWDNLQSVDTIQNDNLLGCWN